MKLIVYWVDESDIRVWSIDEDFYLRFMPEPSEEVFRADIKIPYFGWII